MDDVLTAQLIAAFKDAFMQPVIEEGDYFEVNTSAGTEFVPSDVVGHTCSTHVQTVLDSGGKAGRTPQRLGYVLQSGQI